MSDSYVILAYTISLAILWGYALGLWLDARALRKRERRRA